MCILVAKFIKSVTVCDGMFLDFRHPNWGILLLSVPFFVLGFLVPFVADLLWGPGNWIGELGTLVGFIFHEAGHVFAGVFQKLIGSVFSCSGGDSVLVLLGGFLANAFFGLVLVAGGLFCLYWMMSGKQRVNILGNVLAMLFVGYSNLFIVWHSLFHRVHIVCGSICDVNRTAACMGFSVDTVVGGLYAIMVIVFFAVLVLHVFFFFVKPADQPKQN